jgi:hypothetical protein
MFEFLSRKKTKESPPPYEPNPNIVIKEKLPAPVEEKLPVPIEEKLPLSKPDDLQIALDCESRGNIDSMKYHLLKSINAGNSQSALILSRQFEKEKNSSMRIKYLDQASKMQNIEAMNESVNYYLSQNNLTETCSHLYLLIHVKQPIDQYLPSLFELFSKNKIEHCCFRDSYTKWESFFDDYSALEMLFTNPNIDSKYKIPTLAKLIEMYLIILTEPGYKIGLSEKMCKKLKLDTWNTYKNYPTVKKYVSTQIWICVNIALQSTDIETLKTIRQCIESIIQDDHMHWLFMECCRVIGQLHDQELKK